ncbi:unnamed protein product, partial [Prorocentrum cordatum]
QDEGGGRGEEGENAREGRARPPEGPRGGCWGGRAPSFDPCASGLAGRRAESGAAAIALPRAAPNTVRHEGAVLVAAKVVPISTSLAVPGAPERAESRGRAAGEAAGER